MKVWEVVGVRIAVHNAEAVALMFDVGCNAVTWSFAPSILSLQVCPQSGRLVTTMAARSFSPPAKSTLKYSNDPLPSLWQTVLRSPSMQFAATYEELYSEYISAPVGVMGDPAASNACNSAKFR